MKLVFKISSLLLLLTSFSTIAAPDLKKGNWEMTYTTTMEGMSIPVQVQQQCIKKDDFIPESGQNGDCEHSSRKVSSDKIRWKISCKESNMTGKGEMEFSGKTMNGNMEMKMEMMGQKLEMKIVIAGKYLGVCN